MVLFQMFPVKKLTSIIRSVQFRCLGVNAANFSSEKGLKSPEDKSDFVGSERRSYTFLEAFATKRNPFRELNRYNPMTVTSERLFAWKERKKREADIFNQRYIDRRHEILGNDLATAHFVVFRNGKVRFKGSDFWIDKPPDEEICDELPDKYVRNMYLEAIDASNTLIRYEGLANFVNLKQLKWLSFKNCIHVDDWFLDRLSGEVKDTVEHLDLSNCYNLTKNSLSCIYRFKNLKILVLHNLVNNKEFEFSCMLLEDAFPDLIIDNRNVS